MKEVSFVLLALKLQVLFAAGVPEVQLVHIELIVISTLLWESCKETV